MNDEYSEWTEVPSGVSQGPVLGPVLFVVYINDLPDKVTGESMLYMFADDTKLSRAILDVSDAEILQQDIDNTDEWSREWLMDFHPLKCKVLKMDRTIADLNGSVRLAWPRWVNLSPAYLRNGLSVLTAKVSVGLEFSL